jgi:hypothetical protein
MKNMKLKLSTVLIALLVFKLQAYEARVTIHVVDENGRPVANAKTGIQLTVATTGGLGNGKVVDIKGLTDTNGICVLAGNGDDGSVGIAALKDGYYGGDGHGINFTNIDLILRRWLPWNPTIEVVLQKKGIQVPMYARRVWEKKVPVENKPVGFDLMAGDWVAPYGKGESSDFVFQVEIAPTQWITNWYGTSPRPYPLRSGKMTISFSNDGDGIQSAVTSSYGLRLPRRAPLENYEPTLVKTQSDEIAGTDRGNTKVQHQTNLDRSQNYFFRVRTKKDVQGSIASALYGKIYGEFNNGGGIGDKVSFAYYLNPEPNSLNMEFNPQENLSKDLKFMESISEP